MDLRARLAAAVSHGMRAYYLPLAAGAALMVSAFLPWVMLGDVPVGGVPHLAGYWVLALGVIAVVLASLSIYTRRNSRHPLLLVGLAAFGVLFLAHRWLVRVASEQAWATSQALAIVDEIPVPIPVVPIAGAGIYVGISAAIIIVLFGLTIVVKRVARPYAESDDDDV